LVVNAVCALPIFLGKVSCSMAMVCPDCKKSFEQRLHCPDCAVRLQFQLTPRDDSSSENKGVWQQTPWARLLVGLLLAQGLYYGLRHLLSAGLLAARMDADSPWEAFGGFVLVQVLQAIGVLCAGLLTGAGERRGVVYGAVLGIWSSIFFILAQQWSGEPLGSMSSVGVPILLAATGTLGGFVGSLIWKPLPEWNLPVPALAPAPTPAASFVGFIGPVAWPRVVAGIGLSVGGVVWADVIRDFIVDASDGKLRIITHLQANLVTLEISALAILAGAALAGSSTFNGLKQGLSVGIGAAIVLAFVSIVNGPAELSLFLLQLACVLSLGIIGGWFGGQLLPPVIPHKRLKRKYTEQV
jgi:hypothetical protein